MVFGRGGVGGDGVAGGRGNTEAISMVPLAVSFPGVPSEFHGPAANTVHATVTSRHGTVRFTRHTRTFPKSVTLVLNDVVGSLMTPVVTNVRVQYVYNPHRIASVPSMAFFELKPTTYH